MNHKSNHFQKGYAPLLLLISLGAFWQSGRMHRPLRELRESEKITSSESVKGMPPGIAFTTIALGGFRGIIADMLWMRAGDLQGEGRYFELVQLADWITKLEPRLPEVWTYQAWNMAYNIGGMFDAPEDRWRWVQNGIELLRDEGRVANPRSARICNELAFLFQHKIGSDDDPAHLFYQQQWMRAMESSLKDEATLQRVYKMEPQKMRQLEQELGPIDWRAPEMQALYWLQEAEPLASAVQKKRVAQLRAKSLSKLYSEGRILFDAERDEYLKRPNMLVEQTVREAYELAIAAEPSKKMHRDAYLSFLAESVLNNCLVNRPDQAAKEYADFQRSVGGYASVPMRSFALEVYGRRWGLGRAESLASLKSEVELMTRLGQPDLVSGARWLAGE